jgi:erythromycin esterase
VLSLPEHELAGRCDSGCWSRFFSGVPAKNGDDILKLFRVILRTFDSMSSIAALFFILLMVSRGTASAQRVHASEDNPAPAAVVRWAAAHALPIHSVERGGGSADLRSLDAIVGTARVVALGEPTHGAHEPLTFRNRYFQYLVEHLGFTAIALESGLPESRRIADFVAGGPGAPPPGDAARATRESMTWGFGNFAENAQLVQWMRAYNADPRHRRKIRFYGIDLSLGGPHGSTPTSAAIESALDYLDRVDAVAARNARARFAPYLRRLPGNGSSPFSPAEHDSLSASIGDLIALYEPNRAEYTSASSQKHYAWAHRDAVVAQHGDRVFRMDPPPAPDGGIPPSAWRAMSARDSAMAENVRWVLEQEAPTGRVLVYAHDLHVKNAPTESGVWRVLERPPASMGQYLRAALGTDFVIIGTIAGPARAGTPADMKPNASVDSGSVEAMLARVGIPLFAVDLHRARSDPAAAKWVAGRRTMRTNGDTYVVLSPGSAFDALFFVDSLTPAMALAASGR